MEMLVLRFDNVLLVGEGCELDFTPGEIDTAMAMGEEYAARGWNPVLLRYTYISRRRKGNKVVPQVVRVFTTTAVRKVA